MVSIMVVFLLEVEKEITEEETPLCPEETVALPPTLEVEKPQLDPIVVQTQHL